MENKSQKMYEQFKVLVNKGKTEEADALMEEIRKVDDAIKVMREGFWF